MNRTFKGFYKLLIAGVFSLALLAGCGGGGGGGSSGGSGSGSTANSVIKSYEAYTDSNGIATFSLDGGAVEKVKAVDMVTGEPINGANIILFTDGTNVVYFLLDPKGNYATTARTVDFTNLKSKAMGLIKEVGMILTALQKSEDKPTALTAEWIPENISKSIIENKSLSLLLKEDVPLGSLCLGSFWNVAEPIGEKILT